MAREREGEKRRQIQTASVPRHMLIQKTKDHNNKVIVKIINNNHNYITIAHHDNSHAKFCSLFNGPYSEEQDLHKK